MGCSFVISKRPGGGVGNIDQLTGIPPGVEGRDWRTIEKIGSGRIGRPFRAGQLKLPRLADRSVFHIAGDRDPVREETLRLKGSQKLIGQLDLEAVLPAIGVLALAVDGRLVVQIRLASGEKRPRQLPAGSAARINMNVDGNSVSPLACPAKNIISVADILDVINEADNRAGGWLPPRGCDGGRCRNQQAGGPGRERARHISPSDAQPDGIAKQKESRPYRHTMHTMRQGAHSVSSSFGKRVTLVESHDFNSLSASSADPIT